MLPGMTLVAKTEFPSQGVVIEWTWDETQPAPFPGGKHVVRALLGGTTIGAWTGNTATEALEHYLKLCQAHAPN